MASATAVESRVFRASTFLKNADLKGCWDDDAAEARVVLRKGNLFLPDYVAFAALAQTREG